MGRLILNKLDRKIFIWPFIYSTAIIIALFIMAGSVLYHVNLIEFRSQIRKQQEIEATALDLLIRKYILNMKNDISIFSERALVKNYVINPDANRTALYDSVKNDIEKKGYYYQFRILNLSGYEIFRVNYLKGKACLVPGNQLQDKRKRYYYKEASGLEKDQIMVSNYDYNIEQEKIERPINTTLRIVTPIYIKKKKRAYLIINFNTSVLDEEVDIFNKLTKFNIYIINNQRQFLCYKSYRIDLNHVYEHPDKHRKLIDKLFSVDDFFSISNSYFFKMKIMLNREGSGRNRRFIYLAIELPADKYLSYKKELFRKILYYTLLLFVITLIVVYIFLFLSLLINKRAVQLRNALKLLELSEEGVVITNEKGIIEYINPAFEKMFKCSLKETLGVKISSFNSNFHGKDFHVAMWERLKSAGKWEGDIVDILPDNTRQVKHLKIEKRSDPKTGQVMYLGIYNDITRLKDSGKLIKRLSSLDYLTGLPNKRTILTQIDEKIKNLSAPGRKFSIASIAIYNMKEINNSYGFDIGDKIILLFVERIKGKIKDSDILGRIGDNHFLLISDSSSLESLNHYISGIFKSCTSNPFIINELDIYLSINAGISICPDNGSSGEELIKAASLARGNKSNEDKLTVNYYSDKMSLKAKEKSNLLSLLEKAVERKELYLEFQPKIDCRNGSLVGSEALVRWNNTKLGKVSPSDFIPLAEENGLIGRISYWVIRELCAQIRTWKEKGLAVKPVSFNLSLYDFRKEDFPEYLFACAEKYGVNSGDIQIEITERVIAKNKDNIIKKITQLKNKGFKILIDDFGTGYSSLEYLKEFDIDILKIDRAFIKDYPGSSDEKIIKTICDLARSLDMEIICEGVEIKSQIDFLDSIGCHIIQGFYYSPPVSSAIFENMLVEGRITKT